MGGVGLGNHRKVLISSWPGSWLEAKGKAKVESRGGGGVVEEGMAWQGKTNSTRVVSTRCTYVPERKEISFSFFSVFFCFVG